MEESLSERRLAENELLFRNANEKVRESLEKLKNSDEAKAVPSLAKNDIPVHFYCECSDKKCRKRIIMKPDEHKKLHQNSSQFVLIPGHEITSIERVMKTEDDYVVVEKLITPPK